MVQLHIPQLPATNENNQTTKKNVRCEIEYVKEGGERWEVKLGCKMGMTQHGHRIESVWP